MMYNNLYGEGNCLSQLRDCAARDDNAICNVGTTFCSAHVENFLGLYEGRDELDIRELSPEPCPYSFYADYQNTRAVQSAIGAFVNFTDQNNAVFEAFSSTGDNSRSMHTKEDIAALLTQGVTVVMLAGDADYNCNWLGGEAVAVAIDAPDFELAGYTDIRTSDGIVHGQVRQAGQFAFARVYQSGHEVPFYQPLLSLELFDRIINGKDVATGQTSVSGSYRTVGPSKSTYREGNGTMQWHVLDPLATYNTTINAPNL
jgi:carboxypeptidase D